MCARVRLCVWLRVCVRVCVCVWVGVGTCVRVCGSVFVCLALCLCVRVHTCARVWLCVCVFGSVRVCVSMCVHASVCACVHTRACMQQAIHCYLGTCSWGRQGSSRPRPPLRPSAPAAASTPGCSPAPPPPAPASPPWTAAPLPPPLAPPDPTLCLRRRTVGSLTLISAAVLSLTGWQSLHGDDGSGCGTVGVEWGKAAGSAAGSLLVVVRTRGRARSRGCKCPGLPGFQTAQPALRNKRGGCLVTKFWVCSASTGHVTHAPHPRMTKPQHKLSALPLARSCFHPPCTMCISSTISFPFQSHKQET